MIGPGVTKEYKQKFYGKKACQDKDLTNQIFDEEEDNDEFNLNFKPRFESNFGSFDKELMYYPEDDP